jgi:DNA-binding transcriptional ArsR family regulator
MSLKKYLPETYELANLIALRLRRDVMEVVSEKVEEIERKIASSHEVAALVKENFQTDYEKLSRLPPSCHKVFNFILKNGPSSIYKIRQELVTQGKKRMPLSTIYHALRRLRENNLVEEVRDRWHIRAKGFLPFCI